MEHLLLGAKRLGLDIQPSQERQFRLYLQEMVAWNQRVNLTSVTDPAQVEQVHFLDSLTVVLALPEAVCSGGRLVDVGTGAGFPGVPLKILCPEMRLTLIDSVAKKTAFLQRLVGLLNLKGVEVCTGRAETLARDTTLRERFDAAVSRAVGSLRVLAELTLPFCRLGGRAVLQKKGDLSQELEEATIAFDTLGGRFMELRAVPPQVLGGRRSLVILEKVKPTPERYPRRPGIPAKRPL